MKEFVFDLGDFWAENPAPRKPGKVVGENLFLQVNYAIDYMLPTNKVVVVIENSKINAFLNKEKSIEFSSIDSSHQKGKVTIRYNNGLGQNVKNNFGPGGAGSRSAYKHGPTKS